MEDKARLVLLPHSVAKLRQEAPSSLYSLHYLTNSTLHGPHGKFTMSQLQHHELDNYAVNVVNKNLICTVHLAHYWCKGNLCSPRPSPQSDQGKALTGMPHSRYIGGLQPPALCHCYHSVVGRVGIISSGQLSLILLHI